MTGFVTLLGGGALVALLTGTGIWSAFRAPEPTLTEKLAAERLELDRREERSVLIAQLPVDASDLACSPGPAAHALSCEMVEYGILKKTSRFEVALAPALPMVAFSFHAGTQQQFTLKYGVSLPREQRLAILRAIKIA